MRTLISALFMAAFVLLAGCATTEAPTQKDAAATSRKDEQTFHLGSRIPRSTTDRVVKTTDRDLADEPVRSLGNVVGAK